MVVDYQQSKIYKIVSKNSTMIYIGSTTATLEHRLAGHEDDLRRWHEGKRGYISSYKILSYGDYSIELLEDYPCCSEKQLHEREEAWIKKNKSKCVNIALPTKKKFSYKPKLADFCD